MDSITICCAYSNTVAFHHNQITFSSAIMLIVESNHLRQYACCWHTKSNSRKISSCCGGIMNALALTEFTGKQPMMDVCLISDFLYNLSIDCHIVSIKSPRSQPPSPSPSLLLLALSHCATHWTSQAEKQNLWIERRQRFARQFITINYTNWWSVINWNEYTLYNTVSVRHVLKIGSHETIPSGCGDKINKCL